MEQSIARKQFRLLNKVTVIPLVLVCSLAVLLAVFQHRIFRTDHLLKNTDEAINEARETQALLLTMESNYYSYVVTRRNQFLSDYTLARNQLPATFTQLKSTAEDTGVKDQYMGLLKAFNSWVRHSESLFGKPFSLGIAEFETPQFQMKGNKHMTDIRNAFNTFVSSQMKNRDIQLRQMNQSRENFLIYGILLMVSAAIYLAWYFRKQLQGAFQQYEDQARELEEIHTQLRSTLKLRDLALKSRDDFIQVASHELNTPLTALKLQVQMLKRDLTKPGSNIITSEKLQKFLDQENGQINRLIHLIEDMLAITSIGAGSLKINQSVVRVDELVRDTMVTLHDIIETSGSELVIDLEENINGIFDPERFEQILTNLITNAVKYGNSRPISVKLSTNEGWLSIEVIDHGLGISSEAKERIFGRFERNISASEVSGLGLGLFITRQLVEAHHGHIRVESGGENKGSRFLVEMPLKYTERADTSKWESFSESLEELNQQWH